MYNFSDEAISRIKNSKITRAYMKFPATDTEEELIIDENNFLKDISFEENRYVPNECFIGQAVAKEVTGNFYNVDSNFSIQDREFELYFGVDLEDGSTEYQKYGTFIVQKPENETVIDNTSFTALDYMVKFNARFIDRLEYPCTIKTLLEDICDQAGVEKEDFTFPNEDYVLENNQIEPGTTLREVLKGIAQIAFNWARINENDKLVMDFNQTTEITETITTEEYYSLTNSDKYGEVNTVILRNSQVEGENYTISDTASVVANGYVEIVISDNPFAYTQEKRMELIQEGVILYGLNYIPIKAKLIGLMYLNCNDRIQIETLSGETFETYIFNHTITYNGAMVDEIESPAMTKTETKYQFSKELERISQHTEILVDKANQEIQAIAKKQIDDKNEYTEWKQSITEWQGTVAYEDEVTRQIETLRADINGLTNTVVTNGGNNIFYYSTDFWEKIDENTDICLIEEQGTEIKQNSISGLGYILNNGVSEQKQNVKNGKYLISFLFKKISNLANHYIYINNTKYLIQPKELNRWEEFVYTVDITTYSIDIKIESDTDNSAYISDFLVIPGVDKQIWTQNPNETFTDTVTIGKGIEVRSSSDKNIYTRIDNDGNRTFNASTGERVAEMTDKGVYAKELEVAGQAKIGDLLIQTIDGQVWITGIGG